MDGLLGFENNLSTHEIRNGENLLINPLLECESGAGMYRVSGLDPLHNKLQKYVDSQVSSGVISQASIYFQDLNNGPWFGIDEHEQFAPASLLKLPIIMTYYGDAENNGRDLLSKEIKYDNVAETPTEVFSPISTLVLGQTYKVEDLLSRMIKYSDNAATIMLLNNIGEENVPKTMRELGIELDTSSPNADVITVKGYAGLYRILYNASFLTYKDSSRVLKILSDTHFNKGIVAGVPEGAIVAHKYGERNLGDVNQLHDCGIVYYKKNPYILCVMTKGQSYDNLASFISQVSRMVYDEIRAKYK